MEIWGLTDDSKGKGTFTACNFRRPLQTPGRPVREEGTRDGKERESTAKQTTQKGKKQKNMSCKSKAVKRKQDGNRKRTSEQVKKKSSDKSSHDPSFTGMVFRSGGSSPLITYHKLSSFGN